MRVQTTTIRVKRKYILIFQPHRIFLESAMPFSATFQYLDLNSRSVSLFQLKIRLHRTQGRGYFTFYK